MSPFRYQSLGGGLDMTSDGTRPQMEPLGMRDSEKGGAASDFTGLAIQAARQPWTWSGSDFVNSPNPDSFVIHLDNEDINGIEEALAGFKKQELDGDEVNRNNFPLPTLQQRLERAAIDIHQGCGFCIVRGVDPTRYSPEDNLLIFLGIADYIGDIRGVQDRKGNVISHITDSSLWKVSHSLRHGIHTNADLPFHNDMGTDLLALQVRQCAKKGGDTYVASASKLFCELVATEPEAAQALLKPNWPIQISGNPARHVLAPLMQHHNGKIMTSLDPGRLGQHPTTTTTTTTTTGNPAPAPRPPFRSHPHDPPPPTRRPTNATVPPLTPTQHHALAALSAAAAKHRLRLPSRPGDVVFVNNWALLHARDSYVDVDDDGDATTTTRRHLLRLWLRSSRLGWDVPAAMRAPWEAAFGAAGRAGRVRLYPVVPAPVYKVPKYTSGSAAFVIEESDGEGEGEMGMARSEE